MPTNRPSSAQGNALWRRFAAVTRWTTRSPPVSTVDTSTPDALRENTGGMAAHLLSGSLTGLHHAPATLRSSGRQVSASRRPTRLHARFNPSDPLSWGGAEAREEDVGDVQAEPTQQLTEAELWALLASGPAAAMSSPAPVEAQPATAGESIAAGLLAFKAGRFVDALERFRSSEELPGSGVLRVRGKPRDLSDGERQAARYNSAAALMRLEQLDEALAELSGLLLAGFTDYALLMKDPDFAELRRLRPAEWSAVLNPISRAPGPFDWLLKQN